MEIQILSNFNNNTLETRLESSIWIFGYSEPLDGSQKEILEAGMGAFISQWNAHGALITSSCSIIQNQFLVIMVPIDAEKPSGCSLDSLHSKVSELSRDIGVTLFDENNIIYFHEDRFRSCTRDQFKSKIKDGTLGGESLVADLSIRKISGGNPDTFIKKVSDSWHAKVFSV
jgi:hypothetical protein